MASLPSSPGYGLFARRAEPRPLREHQLRAMGMLREAIRRGRKRIVVQMPTGAGKTRTAAEIITGALAKGNRVAFTVPAISLVDQTIAAFEGEGINAIGVVQASHHRTNRFEPVQIVSVQSLARRAYPEADVVIVDECHVRYETVSRWMVEHPKTLFIGLSATPWAKGMADEWDELVIPVGMQDLIERKLLAPFRVYAPSHPDMSGVKIVNGDYHEGQSAEVMGGLVADVVETWLRRAQGLSTLVFATNRNHAAQLVEQFAAAGVAMGYCDANVDLIERQFLFKKMARGDIAGIVNIGTLTTGVDADVRCIVLARPTRSEMLFTQLIGRALRTADGKTEALILDHADNHARLGFVTDIAHDRLRTGKDKSPSTAKDRGDPMPRDCKSCGALKPAGSAPCPSCGFKPERQASGAEIEVQEGELFELKKSPKHSKGDKQKFWSMACHVDGQRGKGGKLAKALYRAKFGVWPQGLSSAPIAPDGEFLSYERSRRIAFAKSKGRQR